MLNTVDGPSLMMRWCRGGFFARVCWILVCTALAPLASHAQGFSAYISPPRFEIKATTGKTVRRVIEVTSASLQTTGFKVYTADWRLNVDASASFIDGLEPGSCRPWVAIERREFSLGPGQRYRYRFEVTVPNDVVPGECRFALMFEGAEPLAMGGLGNLPISGRVAVIVYVIVGDAEPRLRVLGHQVKPSGRTKSISLVVRNDGNAHGRLDGVLEGVDARGQVFELVPDESPILAGQEGQVVLQKAFQDEHGADPVLPMRVKGRLQWEGGGTALDVLIAP